jgi:PAS domain S-box-containing protein
MRRHSDTSPLAPWRVLLIDDSLDDRLEIRRLLLKGSDRKLKFIEASTGTEALALLRETGPVPDCILLDFNLPDMDAPEVLSALMGPDGTLPWPVVVVTGAGNRAEGRRVLRAGAQDYIGKDSTSPTALSRSLENAAESWAMARELRQRTETLRRSNDREIFRGLFNDATRSLGDLPALRVVASRLLGVYLQASRVIYAEVVGGKVTIEPGYVDGVKQIDGIYELQDYGPWLLESFQAGKIVVVGEVPKEPRFSEAEKLAYANLEIAATLLTPILRNGRLVAIMGVLQNSPREWSLDDIAITREVAERIWILVEHARAEQRLLNSEMQLSQMIELMPSFSALLSGPEHVFVLANQSYYDLIAHGPEILGKPLREAMPELQDQPFQGLLDEVYRTGQPFKATSMSMRLNRGEHGAPVEIVADFAYFALRDSNGAVSGIFIHGLDRTEQFQASQTLAQHERELRSLADNIPDMLSRFDCNFRHLFINSISEQATGYKVAQIIGKTSRELGMEPALSDRWEAAISKVFEGGVRQTLEYSFQAKHQGLRHYATRLVAERGANGQVESVLCITHDITRRRTYERELIEQDRRKDEFLATLAHELRNPLAPVRTGLQLLKMAPTGDAASRTLLVMERQLGQMVRLIDDLLDVSRISSGKIVLKRERIALQDVASMAVEASRSALETAGHQMTIDWPALPVWLDADPARLSQVFSNLLNNAAKYTADRGQISFVATVENDTVRVCVRDSGLGIPAEMLGQVFDMFTQINRTLDRAQGGLGIGLSLTRQLVEMHGGTVMASSPGIDQGSEFTVTLPLAVVGLAPVLSTAVRAAPLVPAPSRRILVVDDNVDAAETMAMLLDVSGYETRTAFSGREALEVARVFRPELIFLDIGMPGMNGYEAAQLLRADAQTASARLIALTGWGTDEDRRKSEAAGFDAHLTKPVEPSHIEGVLNRFLPIAQGV